MATIDKKANRRRGKGRRIQPYAWLGAGAVTLGLGAAMASGTAIAHADGGSDAGNSGVSKSQDSGPSSKAGRTARHSAHSSAASGSAARKAQKDAASDTAEAADTMAPAATAVASETGSSAAGEAVAATEAVVTPKVTSHARTALRSIPSAASSASVADPAAAHVPSVLQTQTDPPWIPDNIVPGKHVALAFQEIGATQAALNQNTWGSGNILGGLASLAPQALLASASFELSAWQTLNPIAQNLVAATANIPIIHQIAQVSLYGTMVLPALSQFSLNGAALLMPVVNFFAPDAVTAASPELAAAQKDGRVYAVVPIRMYNTTEALVDTSINNGSRVPLLIDTGSSGLVISQDNVDLTGATYVSSGKGSYSGGLDYEYDTYLMPVDFGGGAVTDPTYVNVVTAATLAAHPEKGNAASNYDFFLEGTGANGILGIGANAAGPGPGIPTTSLPGELSDGVLIYENFFPFGLGNFMVFGPNPLPPKADPISGAGVGQLNVQIGNGSQQLVDSIIDSGGVYGTMPSDIAGGPYDHDPGYPGVDFVKKDTKISVYAPDGTFLYSFTTGTAPYSPVSVGPSTTDYMNTGYYAFQQGPVYIDYRNDGTYNNGGYGWTVFDIG